jgi:8-oxo-dGTP diphosphatase
VGLIDAYAIIYNHNLSKILIAQRRPGQVYAGYWELPGGKIEPQEDAMTAIVRELAKELAITVREVEFVNTVNFEYPNFLAKLEVFKIKAYTGLLPDLEHFTGAEGQKLFWLAIDDIDSISPMLPASNQVLALLK